MDRANGNEALVEALDRWFQTDLGALVLEQERKRLAPVVEGLFGYFLVEVSPLCRRFDYLQSCPIGRRFHVGTCVRGNDVLALPERLPLASDLIDAVVLPHTLDFAENPHQVLREVERVLIPEGRVVIVGFNPWSLWGLWRSMPGAGRKLPWRGHFISSARVGDWLSLLGFDLNQTETFLFRPPWKRAWLMRWARLMEKTGARFWPRLAGIYIVVATKRVSTLTPIRPRWRLPRKLGRASVEPVANLVEKRNG